MRSNSKFLPLVLLCLAACSGASSRFWDEIGASVSKIIDAAGGKLSTPGGTASVVIPGNAVQGSVTLSVTIGSSTSAGTPSGSQSLFSVGSNVYDFGPSGITFAQPVTMTVAQTQSTPSGQSAVLGYLDPNSTWQVLADSVAQNGNVTATTTHFTRFAVLFVPNDGQGCASQNDPDAYCKTEKCVNNVCQADTAALVFTSTPAAVAGAAVSPAIVVTAHNASGQTDTTFSGTVHLAAQDQNITLSGTTSTEAVAGVASFTGVSINQAGTIALTANATGYVSASGSVVVSAGEASAFAFTVQPMDTLAGVAITPSPAVSALDAYGNVATDFNGLVRLLSGGPGFKATPGISASAVNGVATFSNMIIYQPGPAHLYAFSQDFNVLSQDFNVLVNPNLASSQSSYFGYMDTTIPVNGGQGNVTFYVLNDPNTALPGVTVTFGGEASDATFVPPTAVSDANGMVTTLYSTHMAGSLSLYATYDGQYSSFCCVTSPPGTNPNVTNTSWFPLTVRAGMNTYAQVVVEDDYGNPLPGIAVTFSSSDVAGVFQPTQIPTDPFGTASAIYTTPNIGAQTITASFAGVASSINVQVGPGAPDNTNSTFVVSPLTVAAGGNVTLTLHLVDQYGNAVAGDEVSFYDPVRGSTFTPSPGQADTNGQVIATYQPTLAGPHTIQVNDGTFAQQRTVTVTAGSPDASMSALTAPSTSSAEASIVFELTVEDAYGNPVSALTPDWSSTAQGSLTVTQPTTDALGRSRAVFVASVAQTVTVEATAGSLLLSKAVNVLPAADGTNSTLTLSKDTAVADGHDTVDVTFTVKDATNQPIVNLPVSMYTRGASSYLQLQSGVTGSGGVFSAQLTGLRTGVVPLIATAAGMTLDANVTFTFPGVCNNVLLSGGLVSFGQAPGTPNMVPDVLTKVAVGDINGDGRDDYVAVGDRPGVGLFAEAYEAAGSFSFAPAVLSQLAQDGQIGDVVLHDFDGDGVLDIMFPSSSDNSVGFANGTTSGNYTTNTLYDVYGAVTDAVLANTFGNTNDTVFVSSTTSGYVTADPISGFEVGYTMFSKPVGSSTNRLAATDLNNDGFIDILTTTPGDNRLWVFLNNAAHDGQVSLSTSYSTGTGPMRIATGDFNGDGNQDVAVAASDANSVAIHFGNGDGTLQQAQLIAVGPQPNGVVVADLNGDGFADFAASANQTVSVVLANGSGTFAPAVNYAVGVAAADVNVGDFDGDGHFDLVVVSNTDATTVLYGVGDGKFRAAFVSAPTLGSGFDLAFADFNGDGHVDVVTFGNGSAWVYFGSGDGTFQQDSLSVTPTSQGGGVGAGDFNGDQNQDFVIATSAGTNQVYLGGGDGTFMAGNSFTGGNVPHLAVVTINSANMSGVVAADTGAIAVTWSHGDGSFTSGPTTTVDSLLVGDVSDYNQDGNVDVGVLYTSNGNVMATLYSGDGAGNFTQSGAMNVAGLAGANVWAVGGDVNHGGNWDLVAVVGTTLQVFAGDGQGSLQASTIVATDATGRPAVADLNGDGYVDIAYQSNLTGLTVLINSPGGFTKPQAYISQTASADVYAQDLSGDQRLDLVLASDQGLVGYINEGCF